MSKLSSTSLGRGAHSPYASQEREGHMSTTPSPSLCVRGRVAALAVLLALVGSLALSSVPALAAGDANAASCPNEAMEGFREYLADCRAYEMVTPSFKDGGQVPAFAISENGESVLAESSIGAFAGSEADDKGAFYLMTRSASGWSSSALNPPASMFPAQEFAVLTSPSLGETIWALRTPSQSVYAKDIYIREANGTFVKVGPMVSPSYESGPAAGEYPVFEFPKALWFVGASSDLSHVLFVITAEGPLWAGDTTDPAGDATQSLYEYVGTGNTHPSLVGVSDGKTAVNGETVPSGELLSDCETSLGNYQTADTYNAISASGSVVYFTAVGDNAEDASPCVSGRKPEVSELYARIDGEETVPISEPTKSQCAACNTPATVAEGRAAAEFDGASEDGSKVFFDTTQELLEGDSTDNLYEYDSDAPLAGRVIRASIGSSTPEVQGVARISEDGSHAYFVARGTLVDEPNREGRSPLAGADNLYVYERNAAHPTGHVAFIATLCTGLDESGDATGVGQCPSTETDAADWARVDTRPVEATPDGQFLVFQSVADLTAGDTSTQPQIFEYSAEREELVRVSVAQKRYGATGEANANAHASMLGGVPMYSKTDNSPSNSTGTLAISDDGSTVIFESVAALTEEAQTTAAAGLASVYEYWSTGGIIGDGAVSLLSDGAVAQPNVAFGVDGTGDDAFFETPAPLLSADGDTQWDSYDARIDGGFPPAYVPTTCSGEACQGSSPTQATLAAPASASVPGGGNLAAPPPVPAPPATKPKSVKCKKGYTKKHDKCVKNRKKKAKKSTGRSK
jgi:hypothetical protein